MCLMARGTGLWRRDWAELFKDDRWVILHHRTDQVYAKFVVAHRDDNRCGHWTHSYEDEQCWSCGDGFSKFIKDMLVFIEWQRE